MLKLENLGEVQVEKVDETFVVSLGVGEVKMLDENLDMSMVLTPLGETRMVLDEEYNVIEDEPLVFVSPFALASIGTEAFLESVEGVRESILEEVQKLDADRNIPSGLAEALEQEFANVELSPNTVRLIEMLEAKNFERLVNQALDNNDRASFEALTNFYPQG